MPTHTYSPTLSHEQGSSQGSDGSPYRGPPPEPVSIICCSSLQVGQNTSPSLYTQVREQSGCFPHGILSLCIPFPPSRAGVVHELSGPENKSLLVLLEVLHLLQSTPVISASNIVPHLKIKV